MSKISFHKLDQMELISCLKLLGSSGKSLTVWEKGKKEKINFKVLKFDKDRAEIYIDTVKEVFASKTDLLCSFEMNGMNYFSEVSFQKNLTGHVIILFKNPIYKSERRINFRLITYPQHEVWAEFILKSTYDGGKVIDLKSKSNQTSLFKDFLKILSEESDQDSSEKIKIRIQNLSASGFAADVGSIEGNYFKKNMQLTDIALVFSNQKIVIPFTRVVYVVDLNKNVEGNRIFRIGVHFENLPPEIDEKISFKINELLRESSAEKDFENMLK